jgi:hypothetical protein
MVRAGIKPPALSFAVSKAFSIDLNEKAGSLH